MSRIADCFKDLQVAKKKALIPFITAGDPHPDRTVSMMHTLVKAGANIIEVGIPFSDPMADGPVIQRASERALKHHINLRRVLEIVAEFRQQNTTTPVVLMGYLNPIEIMGYEEFAASAQKVGVDGVLTVDLPPEEASECAVLFKNHGLDLVFLIAPTTNNTRISSICQMASGFVYYVSLKGVTGSNKLDISSVAEKVAQIKSHTQLPIGVGFGIKDAESAVAVAKVSDAIVVGSALVEKIEAVGIDEQLEQTIHNFIASIRLALDAVN